MKLQFGSVFVAETFPLGGRESCTSAVIVLHNQSALIFAGCSGGMQSHFTIRFLDVSQQIGFAWLDEIDLADHQQSLLLPRAFCDSEDQDRHEPEKKQSGNILL